MPRLLQDDSWSLPDLKAPVMSREYRHYSLGSWTPGSSYRKV